MSQWNVTSKGMPEHSARCIVSDSGQDAKYAWYDVNEKQFYIPNPNYFDGWPVYIDPPKYWAYLPEMPKTE